MSDSSQLYKAMIYFGMATLFIYRGSIDDKCYSVEEFRKKNQEAVKRVFDEALSALNYEMSYNQIDSAIFMYVSAVVNPQNTEDTEPYSAS